jgi:hypothetical protein
VALKLAPIERIFRLENRITPPIWTLFEREIHELSRDALHLEKLLVGSDSISSPIRYPQILKRLSEFHRMWREHRDHQHKLISTLSSMEHQLAPIIKDIDALGFSIEQQLKAVSTSSWPNSVQGGLCSLRFAASRILTLIFQQITKERATCAPFIHRRNISPAKTSRMALPKPVSKVKASIRTMK